MQGAKLFLQYGFQLKKQFRGKYSWDEFDKLIQNDSYERFNKFTRHFALKKKELKDETKAGPDIETPEFNQLDKK